MSHFEKRAMKLTIPVGKPVSHAFAKEAIAGLAGAEVDRLAETKGEDAWDREKAKRSVSHCLDVASEPVKLIKSQARENSENMYDQHYVQNQGADQYDPNSYDRPERFNNY